MSWVEGLMKKPSLMSDLCGPLPAGVPGDSVVLGILHAALLTGRAHPMELPPDPLWPRQSRPGKSRTDGTPAPRHSPFTFTALVNKKSHPNLILSHKDKPVYFPRISMLHIILQDIITSKEKKSLLQQ